MNTLVSSKSYLASILSSLSIEDKAWAIKFLADNMLTHEQKASNKAHTSPMPQWWDRTVSPEVLSMTIRNRKHVSTNYKDDLTEILEEKYK